MSVGRFRGARTAATAALWSLAACGHQPSPAVPGTAPAAAPIDTTWFVSLRERHNGQDRRRPSDSLQFGLAVHRVRVAGVTASGDVDNVELTLIDSSLVSRTRFLAMLRDRVQALPPPLDFAVVYVHGYGTGLHEGWTHAATARRRSRSNVPWVVISWPSNGAGIDWPSLGALVERAYLDDSANARASIPSFDRALRAVHEAVGGSRTVLVTHSMGVQLAGEALASRPALRQLLGADPLRAVAFVSPDMEARRFADYIVPATTPLARRVAFYASARDRILTLSRELHGSERAGLVRGAPLTRAGLESIETTLGVRAAGRARRLVDTHHAISRATATLFDLVHIVGAGRAPDCRVTLQTAEAGVTGAWRMTSHPVPALAELDRCPPLRVTPAGR